MKSLVLRSCILGPYVPLRTSSKRKRVANVRSYVLSFKSKIVLIDDRHNKIGLLTPAIYKTAALRNTHSGIVKALTQPFS